MNSRQRRMVKMAGLIAGVLAIIGLIVFGCVMFSQNEKNKAELAELNSTVAANTQIVFVANRDIAKNEALILEGEDANVTEQQIFTGIESGYYMTYEEVVESPLSIVDIPAWTPIQRNMITTVEVANDTREYEVTVANLMTDQSNGDYVDVRIMFPNGEDYVVLTKKLIHNLRFDTCVWFAYMNEEEILRMASATIDAYTITGAYIYTTRYVEENIQDEAYPTYMPKDEIISLMHNDPNMLTLATETLNASARRSLEGRLNAMSEEQLTAVSDGHNLQDTAKGAVLTNENGYEAYIDYGDEAGESISDIDGESDEIVLEGNNDNS